MDLSVLHAVVDQARGLGERALDSGTRLIGHVPHVAPEAWLHALYPPLSEDGIAAVEESLSFPLPADYAAFLRIHNGLRVFSGDLWLGGRRTSYSRVGDAAWQPFDLVLHHEEFTKALNGEELVIGGEQRTGVVLRYVIESGEIHKCRRRAGKPLGVWNSLEEMIASEASRLASCFDATGRRIT